MKIVFLKSSLPHRHGKDHILLHLFEIPLDQHVISVGSLDQSCILPFLDLLLRLLVKLDLYTWHKVKLLYFNVVIWRMKVINLYVSIGTVAFTVYHLAYFGEDVVDQD